MKYTNATTPHKAKIIFVAGLALSCLFIYLIIQKVDPSNLIKSLKQTSIWAIFAFFAIKSCGFMILAKRIQILYKDTNNPNFPTCLKAVFLGFIGNNSMPFRVGELIKIHYLTRVASTTHTASLVKIALERMLDMALLAIVSIMLASLFITRTEINFSALLFICITVLAFIITCLLVANHQDLFLARVEKLLFRISPGLCSKLLPIISKATNALDTLRYTKNIFSLCLCTLLYWCILLFTFWVFLHGMSINAPWQAPLVVLVFVSFSTMIPSSPGFIGTYHYFCALALESLGVDSTTAIAYAIVVHAMAIVPFSLISAPFVLPAALRELAEIKSEKAST